MPVNWRDMETEELGSVYESLLELTPRLTDDGRGFAFAEGGETRGHARKTTGSYYTPDAWCRRCSIPRSIRCWTGWKPKRTTRPTRCSASR